MAAALDKNALVRGSSVVSDPTPDAFVKRGLAAASFFHFDPEPLGLATQHDLQAGPVALNEARTDGGRVVKG